ncbi:hypothetical protein [Undibacterium sp. Tian12W]|uniref:hypothetical protein n=1 Tax=Undibacterium sp. Tian12W TaxID=3413054 RepID=UPI003BEFD63E
MQLPSDLLTYFDEIQSGDFKNHTEAGVHLLNRDEVAAITDLMEYHPLVGGLQGIVLDDPNTSNHHVYLRQQPFSGYILYLAHDDDTRIVFQSLNDFLRSVKLAIVQEDNLCDLHPQCSPLVTDQSALCALIEKDLALNLENELTFASIPSLDLNNLPLLQKLANSDDFFLGEAVAREICKRPNESLRAIAELCSRHPHPQVANAGRHALASIQRVAFAK